MTPAEGVPVLLDRADVLNALRDALNVTDNRVTQAFGKPWLDDAAHRIMAIQPAHPAAASAESIRAEVIEECARELDVRAAFWRKQREEAVAREASVGKRARHEYDYSDLCDARDSECQQRAIAIRALSSRANKDVS